jgi:hypothetical protein
MQYKLNLHKEKNSVSTAQKSSAISHEIPNDKLTTCAPIKKGDFIIRTPSSDTPFSVIKVVHIEKNRIDYAPIGTDPIDFLVIKAYTSMPPQAHRHFKKWNMTEEQPHQQSINLQNKNLERLEIFKTRDLNYLAHVLWDLRVKRRVSGYLFICPRQQQRLRELNTPNGKRHMNTLLKRCGSIIKDPGVHRNRVLNAVTMFGLTVSSITDFPGMTFVWNRVFDKLKNEISEHYAAIDRETLASTSTPSTPKMRAQTETNMSKLLEAIARDYWETMRLYELELNGQSLKKPLTEEETNNVRALRFEAKYNVRGAIDMLREVLNLMESDLDKMKTTSAKPLKVHELPPQTPAASQRRRYKIGDSDYLTPPRPTVPGA